MTLSEPESVTRFRRFLQINTMHPNPDYYACAKFLVDQGAEIGLVTKTVEPVKGKPVVILKLEGESPSEKSLLLSCHTDVVPVFPEFWTHEPFAADRVQTDTGDFKIFARGSQDMKVTGSMYLEALRLIVDSGKKLKRNVYVVFAPDEEIGGADGVKAFVETDDFKELNAGFDLDEGLPSADHRSTVLYAERTLSQVVFTANGNTGHGSQFIEGTAIEKLLPVINELMALREKEKIKLDALNDEGSNVRSGEVTSVNLTQIGGGKQPNVVPATYSVTFDIRVTPNIDLEEFRSWLRDLAAKNDVDMQILAPDEGRTITKLDRSNPFINTFLTVLESKEIQIEPIICPGATDARFVRLKGVPALGFNPMRHQKLLAHDHDEHVLESEYLYGIGIYQSLIEELANV
ncbi:Aminoacylase-1 [Smittium mucronatum]|uniref:Aminoacylase-1 n=1 Tax=Smittium mucronatum TaxID=133383 RepID=A0A1R0GQ52_9FUNG|nr:Aminoacylase-1 [Smittium mucronatum]